MYTDLVLPPDTKLLLYTKIVFVDDPGYKIFIFIGVDVLNGTAILI